MKLAPLALALTTVATLASADDDGLGRHFSSRQLEGAVLLSEEPAGRRIAWGGERLETGFLPASTFKILNALIALEEGVIPDERATFKWDGTTRWVADWNRDHDLASAFKVSAVWYFQELARRIGLEKYRSWLERVDYGNHDVSGGLETFWLEGGLRVTPRQQLDFLRRLHARDLPFSKRAMDTVVRIMKNEERADAVVFSKTGWTRALGPHHAWNIGWVERGGRTSFFVIQLEAAKGDYPMFQRRKEVTEAVLRDLAVLPAP